MPDPTTLKPRMRVRDNDPRMPLRPVHEVAAIRKSGHAHLRPELGGREVLIAVSRIHLDGKPRRSGWSVVR